MNKGNLSKRKVLLVAAIVSSLIYIGWRIFFTIPFEHGIVSLIAGIALVAAETIGVIEAFSHYRNLSSAKSPELPKIKEEWYPEVDVLIATHSESTDLLYKTVNGCTHMKYPDKNKVHIYICDDSNREDMKELADNLGVGYFGLAENKDAKAGNINNALSKTSSPLIVTFDADMIPRSDFLMETVPYFFLPKMKKEDDVWIERNEDEIDKNYKIGFIQTPQSFYNPDLFQFNLYLENDIPNEQDYFFKEVNVGRNRTNTPIYAGSNTVISREALEEVGGITTGTITEDFATGIKIQSKGYKCFAISKVLANGLAPNDFKSLLKQRQRWGRGCVQTIRNFDFLGSDLPIRGKLSYITSFLYWWTFFRRFIYIISPILFIVFGLVVVECSLKEILLIWLPSYILYNKALTELSGNIRNQKWSNIVDTIIFPFMIIPIFLETLGAKLKKFSVTSKNRVNSKNTEFKYAIPHIILIIATLIALIMCLTNMIRYKSFGSIVLLYWLVLNLYFLVMAVFFMLSRVNLRGEERFYVNIEASILVNGKDIEGITSDISEKGMAIVLDRPEYVPYDEDISIVVKTNEYKAKLKGRVVYVASVKDKWKYSVKINEISDEDKQDYYQIVYDRNHTLPVKMKSTTVKEVYNNIFKRNNPHIISNRKLPRVNLGVKVNQVNKEAVEVINFNYQYLLVKNTGREKEELLLDLGDGMILNCRAHKENNNSILYYIENWKEISLKNNLIDKFYNSVT